MVLRPPLTIARRLLVVLLAAASHSFAQVPPKPPAGKPPVAKPPAVKPATDLKAPAKVPSAAAFAIEAITPAALAVRPGKEAACTFEGAQLGEVEAFRVTRDGAVEAGWKFTKALAGKSLLSLKLAAPTNAAAGAVRLEVRRNGDPDGQFRPVALALRVEKALAVPRPASRKGEPARGGAARGVAGTATGAETGKVVDRAKRPSTADRVAHLADAPARRVPRSIDFEKQNGIDVADVRPRERGALGGGFEITGSDLSKVSAVKVGDRVLELVTKSDKAIVGRFPGGVETISGMLSVVVGGRTVPIFSKYEVVDAFARFEPKVTLRHVPSPLQGPAPRADGNCYDRANYIIAFVVEQLPGTECSISLASYIDGFEDGSSIVSGEPIEFTEKQINLNGALTESRPRLSITARDPSLDLSKSYTIELPIELAPRNTVTVEQTHVLRDLWTFEQTWAWGQTNGTSDFGAGPIEVGLVNAGGDLAFRIASGPIGTEAVFRSQLSKLKNGWTVESLEWVEECVAPSGQQPKARALTLAPNLASSLAIEVGLDDPGNVPGNFHPDAGVPDAFQFILDRTYRTIPVLLRPHGVAAANEFLWRRPMVWMDYDERTEGNRPIYGLESSNWLRSMFVAMKAEATALNDHRVTVRLARAVFKGPPGEELASLFSGGTITDERDQIELIPKQQVR